MSHTDPTMSHTDPNTAVTEPAQLREEIEQTREDQARTIDELSSRLDFKARAMHKANAAKQSIADSAAKAKQSVPALAARTTDHSGDAVHRTVAWAKPHRNALVLGSLAAIALVVGLRQLGDRS